jgi:hypothetical protein
MSDTPKGRFFSKKPAVILNPMDAPAGSLADAATHAHCHRSASGRGQFGPSAVRRVPQRCGLQLFCPEADGASLTMAFPSAGSKRSGRDHSRHLACVRLHSLFYSARFATDTSQGRLHVCTFGNGQRIVAVNYATDPAGESVPTQLPNSNAQFPGRDAALNGTTWAALGQAQ